MLGLDSAVGIFILVLWFTGVSTLWIFNNSSIWVPSLRIGSSVCRSVVIVNDPSYSYFTKWPSPTLQQGISSSEVHTASLCRVTSLWRSCFYEFVWLSPKKASPAGSVAATSPFPWGAPFHNAFSSPRLSVESCMFLFCIAIQALLCSNYWVCGYLPVSQKGVLVTSNMLRYTSQILHAMRHNWFPFEKLH